MLNDMLTVNSFHRCDCMQRTVLSRPFCPSVCLSNAWIVTKWKKLAPTFLYHMKQHSF